MTDRTDRMPSITFSDDADYDGLFTLLSRLPCVFDFVLADGTVHTGTFRDNDGDDLVVTLYEDGRPSGRIAQFHTDQLVTAVYL